MANVKLFRVTEFAQSEFQSPLSHRTAIHPMWVMLLVALWIATVGHWPLWQTLLTQTLPGPAAPGSAGVGIPSVWPMVITMALQLLASALLLLALTGWRWTLKIAISVLLLWTALGCCVMFLQRTAGESVAVSPQALLQFLITPANWAKLKNWPAAMTLLVVGVVPAILIWRGRIRRIPVLQRLLINVIVFVAAYALLTWLSGLFSHTLPSPLNILEFLQKLA